MSELRSIKHLEIYSNGAFKNLGLFLNLYEAPFNKRGLFFRIIYLSFDYKGNFVNFFLL